MPGLACFSISFHNPSCQQLPLFNQGPYCSLPSSNFQLSQVTTDGRERHQLNFNLVLPLRKYTKEVALGWLANGGVMVHLLEVWSLTSSHPWWDAVGIRRIGTQKQLMKSRERVLGCKYHHMPDVSVMEERRSEPHSHGP